MKLRPDIPLKFEHLFLDETYVEKEVKTTKEARARAASVGGEDTREKKRRKKETQLVRQPPPTVVDYMYHINAQTPATGEVTSLSLSLSFSLSLSLSPIFLITSKQ